MTETGRIASHTVHAPDCSIWDAPPDSTPDALIAAGAPSEAKAAYLSAVRPAYDAINRVVGQLAGLILLARTRALDPIQRITLSDAAAAHLAEALDRLGQIPVTADALAHKAALARVGAELGACARRLEDRLDLVDPASRDLDDLGARLDRVHTHLLALAAPHAGLAPVDFRSACCTCHAPGGPAPLQAVG